MAKFEFWAKVDHSKCIVEIPDDELEGLRHEEKQARILDHHINWCRRNLYGTGKR